MYLTLDRADPGATTDDRLRWMERAIRDEPANPEVHRRRLDLLASAGRDDELRAARWEALLLGADDVVPELVEASSEQRREALVRFLREKPSSANVVIAAAAASHDRDRIRTTASALLEAEPPGVTAAMLLRLAAALMRLGELRLPYEVITALGDRVMSPRLHALRWRLGVDLEILDRGVRPVTVVLKPVRTDSRPSSLYLLHNSLPHQAGGYATRTHGLLTNLNRAGYPVTGVTRPGFPAVNGTFDQRRDLPISDVIDGVEYRRLIGPVTSMPRSDTAGFVQLYGTMLRPVIEQVRAPILHGASNWWNGRAAVDIASALDLKSVYEVRGLWEVTRTSRVPHWSETDVYRLDVLYETAAAADADRVIAITGGLRDELIRRGVDGDKITVVPNAVDVERFSRQEPDQALIESLQLQDTVVIGFVGSMTFYEGLDDLLTACATIKRRSAVEFSLLFVGDGPIRADLEELAAELDLTAQCRFVGRVPHAEVERYLSIIDVTPFPRKPLPVCEMVSPLKPLESMASGIPVLVSDVAALDEMVGAGAHGFKFVKGDVDDLADQLELVLDSPDQRSEMADRAEEWVRTERTWSQMALRVGHVYEELVG
jgi:glycosyltransferase involved in cell wall biosynthesis